MRTRLGKKQRALLLMAVWLGLSSPAHAGDVIWPRIADGMQLKGGARTDVTLAARYYSKHERQLISTLNRAEPYLWHIVNAVQKRHMPMEVALLPAIESGFITDARSNRRADGLWQFMPGTARLFGLKETREYRARRDPIASTNAALKYLDHLHTQYGDWLLAIAAYNAGEQRVNREIRNAHSRNFWALKLPKETRAHVVRLLGLAQVIRKPAGYGVSLPDIPDKPVTETVELQQPRDLALASQEAGVPHESVVSYNPALRSLSNSGGQHTLLLLPSDANKLRAALKRSAYLPAKNTLVEHSQKTALSPAKHEVITGDSLWLIANRHNITVQQLKTWNNLDEDTVLKPGLQLIVASSK
jgi:membrane-bound lytic murein transglycosylase D